MRRGDSTSRARRCQSAQIHLEKLLLSFLWYAEWKGGELIYHYRQILHHKYKIKDKVWFRSSSGFFFLFVFDNNSNI